MTAEPDMAMQCQQELQQLVCLWSSRGMAHRDMANLLFFFSNSPNVPQVGTLGTNHIGELDLQVRTRKVLDGMGITEIGQLVKHEPSCFMGQRNFGSKSMRNLELRLAYYGLKLSFQCCTSEGHVK